PYIETHGTCPRRGCTSAPCRPTWSRKTSFVMLCPKRQLRQGVLPGSTLHGCAGQSGVEPAIFAFRAAWQVQPSPPQVVTGPYHALARFGGGWVVNLSARWRTNPG